MQLKSSISDVIAVPTLMGLLAAGLHAAAFQAPGADSSALTFTLVPADAMTGAALAAVGADESWNNPLETMPALPSVTATTQMKKRMESGARLLLMST